MGKPRAEIQRAYRERKKAEEGNAWAEKERVRVKKYYKPSQDLSRRELRERREKGNLSLRRHRERVKAIRAGMQVGLDTTVDSGIGDFTVSPHWSTPPGPTTPEGVMTVRLPFNAGGQGKRPRALSKAYKTIKRLKNRCKRNEKRLEREKLKSLPGNSVAASNMANLTPKRKTQAEILQSTSKEGRELVSRKLLLANVICQEIRHSKGENTRGSIKLLHRIVSGKISKKYKLLRTLNRETGLCRRALANVKEKGISKLQTKYSSLINRERSDVIKFLQREDNSRTMPGKRDADRDETGKKVQRFVLCDYLRNLHAKFTSENIAHKISLSTFCRIRRPNIRTVNFASRNICLCIKHQNMAMLMSSMRSEGLPVNGNPDETLQNLTDTELDSTLNGLPEKQVISFKQWKKCEQTDGSKKLKVADVRLDRQGFIDHVTRESATFRQHASRIRAQYSAMKSLKANLPANEGIVQMDFAENYVCKPLNEVQSAYWNQTGVTLHPILHYYQDGDQMRHKSFVVISNEMAHNANTIMCLMDKVIPSMKVTQPSLTKIHYWTDSPTSQYRNKAIFNWVSLHQTRYRIAATWNYWEAGHGKGPCDGLGGTLKRMADDAVKANADLAIQDAFDFHAWAVSSGMAMEFPFVSSEECTQYAKQGYSVNIKAMKGTMKVHAVHGLGSGKVKTRETSCYCGSCIVDIESSSCKWEQHTVSSTPVPTLPHISDAAAEVTSKKKQAKKGKVKSKAKNPNMKTKDNAWYCPICDDNTIEDMVRCVSYAPWVHMHPGCIQNAQEVLTQISFATNASIKVKSARVIGRRGRGKDR